MRRGPPTRTDRVPDIAPAAGRPARRTVRNSPALVRSHAMDIERINIIGTTLADLTERTGQLRGYL